MKYIYLLLTLITFSAPAQDVEAFSWDAATINGKVPLTLRKTEFEAIYKKADSIVAPRPGETCGTQEELDAKFYYYKGVKFELDNGILNFRKIEFAPKSTMYLSYKGTKFNSSFTTDNFKKLFPNAWIFMDEDPDDKGNMLQLIRLITDEPTNDFEWQFLFKNKKLIAIECYFSCW